MSFSEKTHPMPAKSNIYPLKVPPKPPDPNDLCDDDVASDINEFNDLSMMELEIFYMTLMLILSPALAWFLVIVVPDDFVTLVMMSS